MPELPEVEITRRGLAPTLTGKTATHVVVRHAVLRYPIPANLAELIQGRKLRDIHRRGKYLLFSFSTGTLLVHLGMSGSLRLLPSDEPAQKHDHVDIVFGKTVMRLRDPRRFGAVLWESGDINQHKLLATLGVEPLSTAFSGDWLYAATRGKTTPIKLFVMDGHVVVGVGNIYASESLFRARIDPRTPAGRLSRVRCTRLVLAIKETLEAALAAGGSTLRDFMHSDGSSGWFQQHYSVYGREGEACRVCGGKIHALRMGQRSSFFCPSCQR